MRFSPGTGFLYINKHVCKQICPVWLSYNAVVFRCFFFSARGKLISCPSSLLPPLLLISLVALVVFPCRYFCQLGPAFKYAVLKFIVQLAAVLLNFFFTAWTVTFYESARLSRGDT